jgi:hypothetical protein
MYEIWRHLDGGARYLVLVRAGRATAAAGPLRPHEDPRRVLAERANRAPNPRALFHMRRAPGEYVREYARRRPGRVVALPDAPADG